MNNTNGMKPLIKSHMNKENHWDRLWRLYSLSLDVMYEVSGVVSPYGIAQANN